MGMQPPKLMSSHYHHVPSYSAAGRHAKVPVEQRGARHTITDGGYKGTNARPTTCRAGGDTKAERQVENGYHKQQLQPSTLPRSCSNLSVNGRLWHFNDSASTSPGEVCASTSPGEARSACGQTATMQQELWAVVGNGQPTVKPVWNMHIADWLDALAVHMSPVTN
ncbi:hypothetical protein HaLaN_01096 [Haematococcus lacustris]|uniref:Uncharacterized protein n=1 Tax=Haematococcus lacustris TaxID=44745 RepID=A0A699Y8R5_HAELA|nr:hypothetical protein HaLaN_01096 [Haematococcus lacustris]